jgi:hypothetical protein
MQSLHCSYRSAQPMPVSVVGRLAAAVGFAALGGRTGALALGVSYCYEAGWDSGIERRSDRFSLTPDKLIQLSPLTPSTPAARLLYTSG